MGRGSRRLLGYALLFFVFFIFGMGQEFYNDIIKPIINPATPTRHVTPIPTPTIYQTKLKAPTQSPCLRWDQITTSMNNQYICVYGVIYSTNGRRRFDFSPIKNSFFLMEQNQNFYYPNAVPGTCILAWGTVELFDGKIPFIYISELYQCESWMN